MTRAASPAYVYRDIRKRGCAHHCCRAARYAEYGVAKGQSGIYLASMQNAAGNFVQPSEVVNNYNVTEVFGDDFNVPTSLVSGAWANVSLSQSSKPPLIWHEGLPEHPL